MKYRIVVVPPKSKAMQESGKVIIIESNKKQVLPLGLETTFDFEMPDHLAWIYNNRDNKPYFEIEVVYTNKKGTKRQVIKPVPEMIGNG